MSLEHVPPGGDVAPVLDWIGQPVVPVVVGAVGVGDVYRRSDDLLFLHHGEGRLVRRVVDVGIPLLSFLQSPLGWSRPDFVAIVPFRDPLRQFLGRVRESRVGRVVVDAAKDAALAFLFHYFQIRFGCLAAPQVDPHRQVDLVRFLRNCAELEIAGYQFDIPPDVGMDIDPRDVRIFGDCFTGFHGVDLLLFS